MFRFLCLFVPILGFATAAAGQTQPATTVSVEFTVIGWAGAVDDLAYMQSGHLRKLTAPAYVRSGVSHYTGDPKMDIYQKPKQAGDKPVPVASVNFDPKAGRYTVFLAAKDGAYSAFALADDDDKFPVGHARIVNLSPTPIALQCNNSQNVLLLPKQNEIVAAGAGNVLYSQSAYQQSGKWRRLGSNFIILPPKMQTTLIFVQNDADYFKSADGRVMDAIQMIMLREDPSLKKEKPENTSP